MKPTKYHIYDFIDFQTELFIRTPRGVVLSAEGKYFYDHAREILKLYEEVYNHFLRQPTDSDSFNVALNPNVKPFISQR